MKLSQELVNLLGAMSEIQQKSVKDKDAKIIPVNERCLNLSPEDNNKLYSLIQIAIIKADNLNYKLQRLD